MRFIILFLLMSMFAYAIALFFTNNDQIAVDLLFMQVPEMNTAILLVITFSIGLIVGLLLSLLVFRVIQLRWENNRLEKEIKSLRKEQVALAAQASVNAQKQDMSSTEDALKTPELVVTENKDTLK